MLCHVSFNWPLSRSFGFPRNSLPVFFIVFVSFFVLQNTDVGQGEVWLVLTDPSLQEEQSERPCRRTVPLCVNTSCVLTSSVLKTLNSPAVCRLSFSDAIKEHGRALCKPFKH